MYIKCIKLVYFTIQCQTKLLDDRIMTVNEFYHNGVYLEVGIYVVNVPDWTIPSNINNKSSVIFEIKGNFSGNPLNVRYSILIIFQ